MILNSYHVISAIKPTLAAILRALKPGSRLVLVDNNGFSEWSSKPREFQVSHHAIDPALVEREVKEAGFLIVQRDDAFVRQPVSQWLIVAEKKQ